MVNIFVLRYGAEEGNIFSDSEASSQRKPETSEGERSSDF